MMVEEAIRPAHTDMLVRGSTTEKYNSELDRNFAKVAGYIRNNRGSYNKRTLVKLFEKNGTTPFSDPGDIAIFDSRVSNDARCGALQRRFLFNYSKDERLFFFEKFFGLSCNLESAQYGDYHERIMAAKIPMLGWVFSKTPEKILDFQNYDGWVTSSIQEESRGVEYRKAACRFDGGSVESIVKALAKTSLYLRMNRAVVDLLQSNRVNEAERNVLLSYLRYRDPIKKLKELQKFGDLSIKVLKESYPVALKNREYCAKLLGSK